MKIYLAASFAYNSKESTKDAQQRINLAAKTLRDRGIDVFVPHEHKLPNAWDLTNHNWGMAVYGMDIVALNECDCVVALSFGKEKNGDGFAWECGFACGQKKKVVLVSNSDNQTESVMVTGSAYSWLKGIASLSDYDFEHMPQIIEAENEVK